MEGLRFPELLIILAVIAILFGGAKLPQLGAGLGKAIRNFKDGVSGADEREPPPTSASARTEASAADAAKREGDRTAPPRAP